MSTAAHEATPTRMAVAEEVRAAMARARINPTQLARMTGRSQTYWWRRVVSVETPLDIDDLAVVAEILHVSIRDLIPNDEGPRPAMSRDTGRAGRPRHDSNVQPTGLSGAAAEDGTGRLATVHPLNPRQRIRHLAGRAVVIPMRRRSA